MSLARCGGTIFSDCMRVAANAAPAQAQTLQSLGPEGGDVRSLAADAAHPGTVYLGTTDGDVFGSTDAGASWSRLGRVGNDPTAVVSAMVVDTLDARTIFASTWTRETDREGGGVIRQPRRWPDVARGRPRRPRAARTRAVRRRCECARHRRPRRRLPLTRSRHHVETRHARRRRRTAQHRLARL